MAQELISNDARLKLTHRFDGAGGDEGHGDDDFFLDPPQTNVLSATPYVMFAFGPLDALPAPRLKGVWWQIAYQFGAADREPALTISACRNTGAPGPVRIRTPAPVTCLVHERWLANFDAPSASNDGDDPIAAGEFHLPSELRAIAARALHYELTGAARVTYRTAKGLELLCETAQLSVSGRLVPLQAGSGLSAADMQRLFSAKRTIAEQFEKKLTLDSIGRACGLNRAKLTRGFRTVFGTSIAEALSEERLCRASLLLETTAKPVSTIGYEAGYLNNASFTRAFARRFGVCPSEYRHRALVCAQPETCRETVAA